MPSSCTTTASSSPDKGHQRKKRPLFAEGRQRVDEHIQRQLIRRAQVEPAQSHHAIVAANVGVLQAAQAAAAAQVGC